MCLGQIGRVEELLAPDRARVLVDGVEQPVSLLALGAGVGPGDWVVIHSGFALERLAEDEARTALTLRAGGASR